MCLLKLKQSLFHSKQYEVDWHTKLLTKDTHMYACMYITSVAILENNYKEFIKRNKVKIKKINKNIIAA